MRNIRRYRGLPRARAARALSLPVAFLLGVVACGDDSPSEPVPVPGGPTFVRYVALGGATAAGVQSGGISAATQQAAWPALLATRAGVSFRMPLVAGPGCPAPSAVPTWAQLTTGACVLAAEGANIPARTSRNLAVPDAPLAHVLNTPAAGAPPLHALFIGAQQSQLARALAADPTFVSLQAGEAEVTRAALSGELAGPTGGTDSLLVPLAAFRADLETVAARLAEEGTLRGALLVGVLDPVRFSPVLQPGAYFFLARDPAHGTFMGKPVNNNCSPVTPLGQPNPLAANLVSGRVLYDAAAPEISCDPAGGTRYLLTVTEQAALRARVTAYNDALRTVALARNWLFLDPNTIAEPLLAAHTAQGRADEIRKCQALFTATSAAQFQAAVLNTCPVTGTTAAPNFFGAFFSRDGITLSSAAHERIAAAAAALIDAKYGTDLTPAP